jgi:hypothetical protein
MALGGVSCIKTLKFKKCIFLNLDYSVNFHPGNRSGWAVSGVLEFFRGELL